MSTIKEQALAVAAANSDLLLDGNGARATKIADKFREDNFEPALLAYVEALTAEAALRCVWQSTGKPMKRFIVDRGYKGRSYVRVCSQDIGQSGNPTIGMSAHSFICLRTGLIYKPASCKGPTLNFPRGSIYDLSNAPTKRIYGL
jgi:hypothetical protein